MNTGGGIIEEEALADAAGADGVELADALADAPAGEEARGEVAGANGAEAPAAANEAAGTVNAPHTHNGELNESTDEHEGWTAWGDTDEQKTSLPTEPGRYYLTADVTLSAKWEPASGETYLCLNGHTITGPESGNAIKVNSGCTLHLYDAQGDAGKIAVPDHSREVECVYIYSGTFNMYGGTLSGTSVSRGVYMDPLSPSSNTFNMYGGTISRFSVGFSGAGVYASGTFNMYDGSITGNSNTDTSGIAGGVFVYSDGTFNMSGGSITGNTAESGSENVYVMGTFTRTGGTVGTAGNEGIGYLSSNTCAVSFDANGGTGSMTTQYIKKGTNYTLPANAFTRTGYTFAGWNAVASPTTEQSNVTSVTPNDGSMTIYAQWTPTPYTITYILADGSLPQGVTNPTSYTVESEPITLNNPTRGGYTFAGWTGTGLTAATQTVTIPKGSTGNRAYTAAWRVVYAPPDPPAEGPVEPEGVAFVRGKEVTVKKRKKLKLEVRLIPENAETTLTFKSNNKKVARVSGKGVVKGKKKGRAKITVTTANGRKATIIVKVK